MLHRDRHSVTRRGHSHRRIRPGRQDLLQRLIGWLVCLGVAVVTFVSTPVAHAQPSGALVTPRVAACSISHCSYDDRAHSARPPPVEASLYACDTTTEIADPAAERGRVRPVSSGPVDKP